MKTKLFSGPSGPKKNPLAALTIFRPNQANRALVGILLTSCGEHADRHISGGTQQKEMDMEVWTD